MIRRLILGALGALACLGAVAQAQDGPIAKAAFGQAVQASAQAAQAKALTAPANNPLANWFSALSSGSAVFDRLGNSHVDPTGLLMGQALMANTGTGQALAGAVIRWHGNNGDTMADFCSPTSIAPHPVWQILGASDKTTFTAVPVAGTTFTVGGVTLTVVAVGTTPTTMQVQTSSTLAGWVTNLAAAIAANPTLNAGFRAVAEGPDLFGAYTVNVINRTYGPAGAGVAVSSTVTGATTEFAATRGPDLADIADTTNDIRTGATTTAQAILIEDACNKLITSAWPKVAIIDEVPYAYLTTDVGNAGYITPNTPAQAQADSIAEEQIGIQAAALSPNVLLEDWQRDITGTKSQPLDQYDINQIHWSPSGSQAAANYLMQNKIGLFSPYAQPQAQSATPSVSPAYVDHVLANDPARPWEVDASVMRDPRYFQVMTGGAGTATSTTSVQITTTDPATLAQPGDLLCIENVTCTPIPNGASAAKNSGTTVIANLSTLPVASGANGYMYVVRPLYGDGYYAFDSTVRDTYLKDKITYPYVRRVRTISAGVNYRRDGTPAYEANVWSISPTAAALWDVAGYTGVTITNGGTNNAPGDTIYTYNGAAYYVTSVSSGVITGARLVTQPGYTYYGSTGYQEMSQGGSSGSGTGVILTPTSGAIALGNPLTISQPNNYRQYSPTGDFTAQINRVGWDFDTGLTMTNAMEDSGQALSYQYGGALPTSDTKAELVQIGGKLTLATASLQTASTSGAVTVVASLGGTALVTFTCAQGSTSCTAAFNSSGNSARCASTYCVVAANDNVLWTETSSASSGAAGFAARLAR